jgi:hypothetical protein
VKIDQVIDDVQRAEADLAKHLRTIGERHAVEHDLYHLGHALARQCAEHLDRLAPIAETYGAKTRSEVTTDSPSLLEAARHKAAELIGRSEAAGVPLLRDLRDLYITAQEAEICWIILIQVAKACRDQQLLDVATSCHSETEIVGKWLRTRIKESSPQALATG